MKREKIKIGLVFLVIIGLTLSAFLILNSRKEVKAEADDNLRGYAWSSNIGWISMNCENTDSCDTDTSTYGVNIDPDAGNFEGYAWSENIGWINFNPTSGFPDSPYHGVEMDLDSAEVTGWARTVNYSSDDSYGWIKFGDYEDPDVDEEIYLDSEGKMQGYAWGGGPEKEAVIGWVKTSGTTDADDEYGIYAKNAEPYVTDTDKTDPDDSELCRASQEGSPADYELSWTYNDDNDVIKDGMNAYEIHFENQDTGNSGTYHVDISDPSSYPDDTPVTASIDIGTNEHLGSDNVYLKYGEDYSWKVKVQDSSYETAWSDWKSGPELDVPWKYPMPAFSWEPEEPTVAKPVEFDGSGSDAYDDSLNATTVSKWIWDIETATTTITKYGEIVEHTYTETGKYDVTLTVEDHRSPPLSCSLTKTIKVEPKPDEWREVLPR